MNQTDASFVVNGTKKGAFPARVETRKFGKKVTVLDNCAGDLDALVSHVKKKLGCGGHVSSRNTVELATSDVARVCIERSRPRRRCAESPARGRRRKERKADAARTVDAEGQTRRETPRVKPRHDATRRAATASRGGATVVVAGEPKAAPRRSRLQVVDANVAVLGRTRRGVTRYVRETKARTRGGNRGSDV